MELAVHLLQRLMQAALQLIVNPFTYIGILFIILQYRKQIQLERKLFHTRLHSLLSETWRTVLWGWAGGLSASILMLFVGVSIQLETVMLLWGIAIVLLLFRVRFLCMTYAVGVLGIAHAVMSWFPQPVRADDMNPLLRIVLEADIPSLLILVAVLHVLEGLYVGAFGARMASPLFLEGKRGRIIGGYQLQGFWPVPLFLLVPLSGGSPEVLPWGTLLGANLAAGWSLLAFPAMIGFTDLTVSKLPKQKLRLSSSMLLLFGVLVFALGLAAHYWPPFIIAAAILTVALHEALTGYSSWNESRQSPFFAHSGRGLMVLAVVPNGPADELGIQAGEILHKVNGHKVETKTDLHYAIRLNSAFCKLEVLDAEGEIRFLQRAIFSGDHHQLGIILAPDQQALYYLEQKPVTIFSYLRGKLSGVNSNQPGEPM